VETAITDIHHVETHGPCHFGGTDLVAVVIFQWHQVWAVTSIFSHSFPVLVAIEIFLCIVVFSWTLFITQLSYFIVTDPYS
jgi:hypothetical protein